MYSFPTIRTGATLLLALLSCAPVAHAFDLAGPTASAGAVTIADDHHLATIVVDADADEVVKVAAKLFADDVTKVTGKHPVVTTKPAGSTQIVIAGTLGHSKWVDQLAKAGKLKDLDKVKGRWEATLWQTVTKPFPGVDQALVIVGSDRRGTAYGLTRLSEKIGVSPWYWWADAQPARRKALAIAPFAPEADAPAVRYRGIFINDEDWGLHEWAKQTFEPEFGGIGPKTYEKVFELMLRLRLNTIWPAMHEVSREFHTQPESIALADKYGIVAGASHCEPMLYNNVHWNQKTSGPWNYLENRDAIHAVWEEQARTRGDKEGVWTLGIRGIHDAGMQGPKDTAVRIGILDKVFADQRALIDRYVSRQHGDVGQLFVPYKEVLPLYDAGLKVPDDVTIVWVDDNFGYIRRLGGPAERKRAGGAGVYWHLSYYGGPHSYTWINTTPPALMWEELHKAWENDARKVWMLNVGDIKPMEIGIDYFSKFAWNPTAMGADSQPAFLRAFAAEHLGDALAEPAAELLREFYRLGTIRKPELMVRDWALALPDDEAARLRAAYTKLLDDEARLAAAVPAQARDAYAEMIGFPARVLGATGLIFMADRDAQNGKDPVAAEREIARLRGMLEQEVERFNTALAGGKWRHVMPGLMTARDTTRWNSQVRWPWGEKQDVPRAGRPAAAPARTWRDAAAADRQQAAGSARWTAVPGLGASSRAVALQPTSLGTAWQPDDQAAPALEFAFQTAREGAGDVLIDFLPTFRTYPGLQMRVAAEVDGQAPVIVEVPGSSGKEDEGGPIRSNGVQDNRVRASFSLPNLGKGSHVLKIRAIDPGVVIDRVSLPD